MAAERPRRSAAFPLVLLGLAIAAGCGSEPVLDEPANPVPLPPVSVAATPSGILELTIPTYDGSGEAVEPAVLHFPAARPVALQ